MYALFNTDLKFIGYSPDMPSQPHILKKEIPTHQNNLNVWKWSGDFNSGKMVSIFEEGFPDEEIEAEKAEDIPLTMDDLEMEKIILDHESDLEIDKFIAEYDMTNIVMFDK
jgi:hypothetical protein